MRRTYITLLLAATVWLLAGCNRSDDHTQPDGPDVTPPKDTLALDQAPALATVYEANAVPEITLEVTTQQWNTLLSNFDINPDNEEYIMANYRYIKNGKTESIDSIGIRIRGNTSRRRPEGNTGQMHNASTPDWKHAHFALNFKKYVKAKRFNTLQKMNLKWFKDDPNYVREVYSYDLFERFGIWTAPQSSYCRLTIKIKEDSKPAYFGVYQMVESVDEDFIANRAKFNSKTGFLWKSNWGADLKNTDRNRMGVEDIQLDASKSKTYVYDLKTNDKQLEVAKDQLVQFMNDFNAKSGTDFQTWLTSKMDVDLFLKTYAVNVMLGMWDDYWANTNNFYFYFDGDGKFYFIPYDYDNTLGTSLIMSNSGTQDPTRWGNNNNPLVKKILDIPAYRAKYLAYMRVLADPTRDFFHADRSIPRILYWQSLISPYVSNDTGEDMKIEDKPAGWGNCGFYRLLSGDDTGGGSAANFFKTKVKSIPAQ